MEVIITLPPPGCASGIPSKKVETGGGALVTGQYGVLVLGWFANAIFTISKGALEMLAVLGNYGNGYGGGS